MRMGLCSIKYYKYTSASFAICECLRELRSAEHEAIRGITIIGRGDFANEDLQCYKKHRSVSFAICECLRELREVSTKQPVVLQ